MSVERDGFQKTLSKGAVAVLNLATRTDVALRVGSATTEVTVSAATPALSTDDAVIGETIGTKQVENLPQNTRRVLELAATASNIIVGPKTSYTGNPPGANFIGAGTREVTNSLTLDGITIMNSLISSSSVTPNPDAVAAVQTQTGNYTAQYGAYMGVHINVDTRSGTNKLHGTAYDYIQNDFFNAKGWLTAPGARTPSSASTSLAACSTVRSSSLISSTVATKVFLWVRMRDCATSVKQHHRNPAYRCRAHRRLQCTLHHLQRHRRLYHRHAAS